MKIDETTQTNSTIEGTACTQADAPRSRFKRALRLFQRSEDGSMIIFGLFCLILMLIAGGIAVDTMRYEANRTKLQNTLDRAVLAAASLNQTLDPQVVVTDYFSKAGLQDYTLNVQVEEDLIGSYRKVTADASIDVNSLFLHWVGIDSIRAPANGIAEERVLNVEVSLVLDISGSMGNWSPSGGKSKMALMQEAATEFVSTLLVPEQAHLITISVIPYNGKVNAGSLVADYFPLSTEHTFSNCVRFTNAQFTYTGLGAGEELRRLGHFDRETGNNSNMSRPWCPTDDYGAILPWSNNPVTINTAINALQAEGWTAIDLGMKWASLLVDPTTRPMMTAMIDDLEVPATFAGRPVDYSSRETMKVIVLMTDGSNTNQYDLKEEFKSGMSNVYVYERPGRATQYSYYIPETGKFRDPWDNNDYSTPIGGNSAVRLTYPQLWARYPVRYVRDSIYVTSNNASSPHNWKNRIGNAVTQYGGRNYGDARLDEICDATKAAGQSNLVIFTIGFEAPTAGEQVLQKCATTASHYYDVNGIEITEAFAAIARTINQLRLTQ